MRTPALIACALVLGGCAATSPPVAEISAARTMVSQAQPAAAKFAPAELRAAQGKLDRAEAAMARQDWIRARMLAEQAEVDAKLAWSVADNERTRRASAELAQSMDELKHRFEESTK